MQIVPFYSALPGFKKNVEVYQCLEPTITQQNSSLHFDTFHSLPAISAIPTNEFQVCGWPSPGK